MKPIDRYIHDVMANVFAAPEDRERFEADLRSHFAEADAADQDPRQVIEAMGKPEDVAAAFNAEREIVYAGFWRRLVAFVGDCGVFFLAGLPFFAAVVLTVGQVPQDEVTVATVIGLCLLVFAYFGAMIFYFPLLEARFGKTFGKHLMRIRVVRETGGPIGLGQGFVRRLSMFFEMLAVDALFIPFTEKKQRALDIIAKTVVVREPGEEASWSGYTVCLLLPLVSLAAIAGMAILCAPPG